MTGLVTSPAATTTRRPTFHPLTVQQVERLTDEATAITFAVPAELAEVYRFAAGQHLTLRRVVDGAEVRNSYSICQPARGELPPVRLSWYDGGLKPPRPDALGKADALADEGLLFLGDDGAILCKQERRERVEAATLERAHRIETGANPALGYLKQRGERIGTWQTL